jgi:UrcA family protein
MISSKLRFGFPLAIALATASVAAVAQQTDQTSDANIGAGKVQQTEIRLSYTGIPIDRFQVDRPVSYADLDLTTVAGATELVKRVTEAAKDACEQVDAADPVDFWDTDDTSCTKTATDGGLKQANAAIAAAQTSNATRTSQVVN